MTAQFPATLSCSCAGLDRLIWLSLLQAPAVTAELAGSFALVFLAMESHGSKQSRLRREKKLKDSV